MSILADSFILPDDGWFQISAVGDFPHPSTGLVQVIDSDAIAAIVQKFTEEAAKPNFPGVLVDWDHASLDLDKPTEAAGWIMALEQRPDGLWGQIRWSDRGAEAVRGGRYRFMSPVWRQEDCLDLGEKKVRPQRLYNCALTNDPNIKGMVPLANSARPLTEEQRKAMFARMGGGGGGYRQTPTGWERDPNQSGDPAPGLYTPPATDAPAVPGRADPRSSPKVEGYRKILDQLNSLREEAPPAPRDPREQIDIRALRQQMMREGRSLNEQFAAIRAAEQENESRRAELRALRRYYGDRYSDPDARDNAVTKNIEARERVYQDELEQWQKRNEAIDREIRRTDAALAAEQTRLEQAELRTKTEAERRAYQEEQRRAREQVARDKEATRLAEAQRRQEEQNRRQIERDRQANEPTRVYRQALTRRRAYWDALSRGDRSFAERIYPGADHQKNADAMKQVEGWKDKAKRLRDTEPI